MFSNRELNTLIIEPRMGFCVTPLVTIFNTMRGNPLTLSRHNFFELNNLLFQSTLQTSKQISCDSVWVCVVEASKNFAFCDARLKTDHAGYSLSDINFSKSSEACSCVAFKSYVSDPKREIVFEL